MASGTSSKKGKSELKSELSSATAEALAKGILDSLEGTEGEVKAEPEPQEPYFNGGGEDRKPGKGFKMVSEVFDLTIPEGYKDFPVRVFKDSDWPTTIRIHIPNKIPGYIPQPTELLEVMYGIEHGDNVWLTGPTGSGKSSLVQYICSVIRQPFIRMNGRGDMESGPIFGQYIVKNGETIWKDGACTEAMKNGAIYLQDEPTVLPAEISMGYQWLLENNGKLFLSDKAGDTEDKLVVPHDRARFICADNTLGLGDNDGSYSGTQVWNTATLDRFATTVFIDHMPLEQEVSVLQLAHPDLTNRLATQMVKLAGLVRTSNRQGNMSLTMSLRTLSSWAEKSLFYQNYHIGLKSAFFEKLPLESDRSALSDMFRTIFGESLNIEQ